jgi:hypothetical protein
LVVELCRSPSCNSSFSFVVMSYSVELQPRLKFASAILDHECHRRRDWFFAYSVVRVNLKPRLKFASAILNTVRDMSTVTSLFSRVCSSGVNP